MDRLQIGAIALAVALLALSFLYGAGPAPAPEPGPSTTASAPRPAAASATLEEPLPRASSASEPEGRAPSEDLTRPRHPSRRVMLRNDAIELVAHTVGGRVESIELPRFRDRIQEPSGPVQLVTTPGTGALVALLGRGPLAGLDAIPHEVLVEEPRRLVLRLDRGGFEVTRTLTLDDAGYGGRLVVGLKNRGTEVLQPEFQLVWQAEARAGDAPDRFQNLALVAYADSSLERHPVAGIGSPGFFGRLFGGSASPGESYPAPVEWAGLDSQYFLAASIAENPREATAFVGPRPGGGGRAVLSYRPFQVPPGTGVERTYRLYLGPKVASEVVAVDGRLDPALAVGWTWVRPLVDLFAGLLTWTHEHVVSNYGVAIILLTIVLRLVTYPLTQRSMKSMKRFTQVIAPQLKELQEKHKDDKAKLQEEMMSLYRQKGMNPLTAMGGGCLPMLIQMPFMIALYFALQSTIELRHAPFMWWIDDLSAPENLFAVAGIPVRVLPLLMGASMILQQRLSPTPPTADAQQQRQMMTMMSVVFIFLFYQFPSGLVLYWFVSNLLGIAQQLLVNRQTAQ